MTENENNDTKQSDSRWQLLWSCFAQVNETEAAQQQGLLNQLQNRHPELFPELTQLLASHHSDETVLDRQLFEQSLVDDFSPPVSIAGFKILEPLGAGGVGDVYKACRQEDDYTHTVAIKFAPAGRYAPMVLHSFSNELKILLSLNHPHIERLYEGGVTEDNIPYLVVEYIEGVHIDDYCDQQQLNIKQRIEMFLQVCDAVTTMHQSLIIHRDIKASNIMVNEQAECKLLDFGLAKLTEKNPTAEVNEHTVSGYMMTLAYASPEQIRGQTITTASDVYSLGMLLYYLLTGQLPYRINNNDLADATTLITSHNPPLASQNIKAETAINLREASLHHKLHGELDAILAKAIDKDPKRRYASALQLAEDLNRHLHHLPIMAKQDTVIYRAQKFIQRHVAGVIITVAVMGSLLLLSVLLFNRSVALQKSLIATQEEQQRVVQVTDFLIDIFKLSDPLKNQSEIVNVKDLLDYSSDQLAHQFDQQPKTKAKLYETLGTVYLNMSDIEAAEHSLNMAQKMNIENTPLETLEVMLVQAELMQKKGLVKDALGLLKHFEAQYKDLDLPVSTLLRLALSRGQLLYQSGQLDAASEVLTRAAAILLDESNENMHFKEEQLKADIHQLLGNVYWKKGNLDAVEINYQKSFDSNSLRLGLEHHATLKSLSALGVLAYSQGHYELAKTRFEKVLASRAIHLGESHYLTADAHNRLGATEYELGHLSAAETHYMQAMQAFAVSGLRESIKFTRVLNNLGLIKRQQTKYQQAEQLFQQALDIQTKLLGQGHPDLAAMLNNLGLTAYDQANFEQALAWFEQAYQVQFDANGLNNANIAFAMTNMGRMYLRLDQTDQSINWINQALQLRAEHLGTDHLLYAATLMAEAELNFTIKNHEKAAKSAEQALKIRKNQLGQDDWRLADSRHLWHSLNGLNHENQQQMCVDAETIKQRFGQNHPRAQVISQRVDLSMVVCDQ